MLLLELNEFKEAKKLEQATYSIETVKDDF